MSLDFEYQQSVYIKPLNEFGVVIAPSPTSAGFWVVAIGQAKILIHRDDLAETDKPVQRFELSPYEDPQQYLFMNIQFPTPLLKSLRQAAHEQGVSEQALLLKAAEFYLEHQCAGHTHSKGRRLNLELGK